MLLYIFFFEEVPYIFPTKLQDQTIYINKIYTCVYLLGPTPTSFLSDDTLAVEVKRFQTAKDGEGGGASAKCNELGERDT